MNTNSERVIAVGNAGQAAAWNGPEGANWAEQSARRVRHGDLVDDLLRSADLALDERVLDLGCGTGELTRRAARLSAHGHALGIDLSELMVDRARAEAAAQHIGNVRFEVGDVQVHRFEPGGFDVALSHFGTMFFDDPVAAFANVAVALRRSGRLAFVCPGPMETCDWYTVPLAALYGERPTMDEAPSVMFSLAHPPTVRDILVAAGFADVTIEPLDGALWFGPDAATAAAGFLRSGPVRSFLERNPATSTTRAQRALAEAVGPYLGPDGIRIPGSHWLVRAAVRATA